MTNMPFFTRDGDTFHPTEVANGPWDPKSLHGRVIIGLLGFAIEERHSGPEFVPARLTVDMFRLPTIDKPIEVTTRLVRGAAVWALGQLLSREAFEAIRSIAMNNEHDDSIRAEWQTAS